MRTITLEEHFVTQSFLDAIKATGRETPPALANLLPKLLDIGKGRVADMDAAKIDLQILSLAAVGLEALNSDTLTPLARDINDELAEATRNHPARLAGFALLNLEDPAEAVRELQRCVTTLGFKGALLDGTVDGLFLDDPRFFPIFEAAAALDVPVYLHPASPPHQVNEIYYKGLPGPHGDQLGQMLSIAGWGWHAETALHTLRLIVSGLFDRLPKLQLIIGHMGEMLPMALARTSGILNRAAKLEQGVEAYFQTNIHITTSGYFTRPPLSLVLNVIGIDRLMFSVDYPFSSNDKGREFLNSLALSPADTDKLTHGNAERLLRV